MLKYLGGITGVLLVAAFTINAAEAKSPEVTPVEGAPTLMTGAYDVATLGYTTDEYFVSGVASSYTAQESLNPDGRWTARVSGTAPYRTRIVVMRPTDPAKFNGTVIVEWLNVSGRPTPWNRVVLMDDDMRPVPDGEPGEICVQGPLLMAGYLNKAEETEQALAGGWLHTGDVAIKSPDGFLQIVDRKKDMIVTGGFNVFAREVEDVLVTHPAVRQAAVIGVPDPKWGRR